MTTTNKPIRELQSWEPLPSEFDFLKTCTANELPEPHTYAEAVRLVEAIAKFSRSGGPEKELQRVKLIAEKAYRWFHDLQQGAKEPTLSIEEHIQGLLPKIPALEISKLRSELLK
jgi:hypothetical protein